MCLFPSVFTSFLLFGNEPTWTRYLGWSVGWLVTTQMSKQAIVVPKHRRNKENDHKNEDELKNKDDPKMLFEFNWQNYTFHSPSNKLSSPSNKLKFWTVIMDHPQNWESICILSVLQKLEIQCSKYHQNDRSHWFLSNIPLHPLSDLNS